MFKKFFGRFGRKKVNDKNINLHDALQFISDIENLLKIQCSKIVPVAQIFDFDGICYFLKELDTKCIPEGAQYKGACYRPDLDLVFMSTYYPVPDFETFELKYTPLTVAEYLFYLAHECRHIWQKKYEEKTFYKKNAIGLEHFHDPAEIDADAFALAYVFSDRTPYTFADLPNVIQDIQLDNAVDHGERWARANEMAITFDLKSNEKIDAAMTCGDKDKISFLVGILKLSGKI